MRAFLTAVILFAATPLHAQVACCAGQGNLWDARAKMPGYVWGSKIVIEDRPCCEQVRGTQRANDIETKLLSAEPHWAARDGQVLNLSIGGGRTLKITDCDKESCSNAEFRKHTLVSMWSIPGARYYVVDVGLQEGRSAYLIRESDGLVVRLAAAPLLSPDDRFAIAYHSGVIDGGPSIELLDMKQNPPIINSIYPNNCLGHNDMIYPGNPTWLNDQEVVFDGSTFFGTETPKFKLTLQIRTNWDMTWQCQL